MWPTSAPPTTTPDTKYSQVALLLHGDALLDSSRFNRTVTAFDSAAISTAEKKFGTGSIYLPSAASRLDVSATGGGFAMDGDFVIEWWQKLSSASAAQFILAAPIGGWFRVSWNTAAANSLTVGWPNPLRFDGASITANAWQHVAISRSGSTCRLYLNGVLAGSQTDTSTHTVNPTTIRIGASAFASGAVGYIDELRWTCGSSRGYTGATITVPTAAYPDVQDSGPYAIVLTGGSSYPVPTAGYTTVKAWSVGQGGMYGGGGGVAYKSWALSGGSIAFSVGSNTTTNANGANSTITYSGTTITGGGGMSSGTGGTFSGGDGGATGGAAIPAGTAGFSAYTGQDYVGGAAGGNGVLRSCGRRQASDVSGLFAAIALSGGNATENCTTAAFASGGYWDDKSGATVAPGRGGGGVMPTDQERLGGAVVLYFS